MAAFDPEHDAHAVSDAAARIDIPDNERYSRQILFGGIGERGQKLLQQSRVAIVGVGATGAATASLLARAGIGHLTLIDRDFVEPSNLQRQMLFDEADAHASLPKAEAARRHIFRINSSIEVAAQIADLVPHNAEELLHSSDIVLDCTDNFETRYLINDFCVRDARPWIYAGAIGASAATMNILPLGFASNSTSSCDSTCSPTACLACVFPAAPQGEIETCDTSGILSTAVNLAASIQATEALKFLTAQPQLMRRTLLSFDLWASNPNGSVARSEISTSNPRADCEVCGLRIFRALAGDARPHITLCGRNSVQIHEHNRPTDLGVLKGRVLNLPQVKNARANGLLLRFEYSPYTLTVFSDGRTLVQGTTDIATARSLYARLIGA